MFGETMKTEEVLSITGIVSFWLGMLLVLINMFFPNEIIGYLLVLLGLIVGFLNIDVDEIVRFLVSIVALIISSVALRDLLINFTLPPFVITLFTMLFNSLVLFFGSMAVIVALGSLIDLSRD